MLTANYHIHNDSKVVPHALGNDSDRLTRWVETEGLAIFGDPDNLQRLAFALIAAAHKGADVVSAEPEPEPEPVSAESI